MLALSMLGALRCSGDSSLLLPPSGSHSAVYVCASHVFYIVATIDRVIGWEMTTAYFSPHSSYFQAQFLKMYLKFLGLLHPVLSLVRFSAFSLRTNF